MKNEKACSSGTPFFVQIGSHLADNAIACELTLHIINEADGFSGGDSLNDTVEQSEAAGDPGTTADSTAGLRSTNHWSHPHRIDASTGSFQLSQRKGYFDLVVLIQVVALAMTIAGLISLPFTIGISAPVVIGFGVAVISVVSVFLALGPGTFLHRALVWYGSFLFWMLVVLLVPFAFTMQDSEGQKALFGILLFMPSILLVTQAPLWVCRFFMNWRIVKSCDEPELPFGVSDFLVGAIVVSITLGSFQMCVDMLGMPMSEFSRLAPLVLFSALVFSCTVLVPSVIWLLDSRLGKPQTSNFVLWTAFSVTLQVIFFVIVFHFLLDTFWGMGGFGVFLVLVGASMIWLGFFLSFWFFGHQSFKHGLRLVTSGVRQAEIVYLGDSAPQNAAGILSDGDGTQPAAIDPDEPNRHHAGLADSMQADSQSAGTIEFIE